MAVVKSVDFTHLFVLVNWQIMANGYGKVQSMDDNCGEWVECMGVASGCGEQEVGVASGSGWNLWVWLVGVGGIYGCGYWVWL